MKLSTRIVTAVLLIAGSSGVVYALSRHGDWHMAPGEKVEFVTERVSKQLELDSQQQQNFTALADLVMEIMLEVRASREENLEELFRLLDEPGLNQGRALELVQQKTALVNEKAPEVIAALALFLDSLNAEQKAELRDHIEHHREHRHGHRHDH